MPDILAHSPDNAEFARVVEVAKLRGVTELPFDLVATPEEAAAVARLMDAQAVRKLRFRGRLSRAPREAWRLEAELGATVVQTCVVTLEPVTARIDAPVRRLFTPDLDPDPAEVVLMEIEEDEREPLTPRIDLGLVAIEALALELPDYPRLKDAELPNAPGPAAADSDAEEKPFAGLAALRSKMDGEA